MRTTRHQTAPYLDEIPIHVQYDQRTDTKGVTLSAIAIMRSLSQHPRSTRTRRKKISRASNPCDYVTRDVLGVWPAPFGPRNPQMDPVGT
jgi:hypothetical protein